MKRGRAVAAMVAQAALALLAAGCGGSVTGETCGVAPCGGDVVGDWTASSACMDRATLKMDFLAGTMGSCPSTSLGAVNMTSAGTLAMGADMTFTGTLVVNATIDVNYPPACINNGTCAAVEATLQNTVGTNGITSVRCAGTGSCVCTTALTIDIINATGTWATSGTMLTFAGAPGGDGPYCVQGSSLHLVALDRATMTKVINDIVLTKP